MKHDLLHTKFFDVAEHHAEKLAIEDPWDSILYSTLAQKILALSSQLQQLSLEKHARIMIRLPNCIEFIIAKLSIIMSGMIAVPVDYHSSNAYFNQVVQDCAPTVLITNSTIIEDMTKNASKHTFQHLIHTNDFAGQFNTCTLHAFADLTSQQVVVNNANKISSSDIASIMYTTGSTAAPKGVMLSHENITSALNNICSFIHYTPEDRELVALPISHNFGLGHVYCNLLNGGSVCLETGLTRLKRLLNKLESFQATGFPGTPLSYGIMLDRYADMLVEKTKSLRFAVINSAPLPPKRAAQIAALLPHVNLMVYYGLTEASRSTFISLSQAGPSYYSSVGKAFPSTRLTILDDNYQPLPSGNAGKIAVHGSTVTNGYWNNPEATKQLFHGEWMLTGDLGYLDNDGYLHVVGREKDIINVGGYKVAPAEVEESIATFPAVLDVGVIGIDSVNSEIVVACIVKAADKPFDWEACRRHCATKLENYKVPTCYHFVDAIPRSDTGKVKRQQLKKEISRIKDGDNVKC
jgi:long-chain acyl-CoA synthetase